VPGHRPNRPYADMTCTSLMAGSNIPDLLTFVQVWAHCVTSSATEGVLLPHEFCYRKEQNEEARWRAGTESGPRP